MDIEAPTIPYNFSDLEPALSRDTLVFHFGRHQRLCFDRMRALVHGTPFESLSLEELIRATERTPAQHTLYRWAAEVWNHSLYWQSMRPRGGGAAYGAVGEHIRRRFGSYERFAGEFRELAGAHFGSGWLWLVWREPGLELVATGNAGTPLVRGDTPLLALDLWEHAYFLDYQNRRGGYVNAFLEELVNWDSANRILARLLAPPPPPLRAEAAVSAALAQPGSLP